jgi:hypothetical protein
MDSIQDGLMKRNRVLDRAKEVINGPREDSYGSPRDNHQRIADIWSAITGYKFTPEMVVMMMIGTKLARLRHKANHEDSWVDIAGYAGLGWEINNG